MIAGVWALIRRDRAARFGAALGIVLALIAIVGPFLTPLDPNQVDIAHRFAAPSPTHLLGTDDLGRDTWTRLVHGSRVSLEIAFASTIIATIFGQIIGLISGFAGGWVDIIAMRLVDLFFAIPTLLVAIGIVALFGASATTTILALGIAYIPFYARLVRGAVVGVRSRQYVDASRVLGSRGWRLLRTDILPGVLPIALVQSTALLGYALVDEASLGFLGLGVQPPDASWGQMINAGRQFVFQAPWLTLIPGAAVIVAVFAINLIGDAFRDLTDPRASLRGVRAPARTAATRSRVAFAEAGSVRGVVRDRGADVAATASAGTGTTAAPLLEVRDLVVEFALPDRTIRAVDGVTFSIGQGEIVGLVGESGSGKSVTMLSLLRLVPPPGTVTRGAITYRDRDMLSFSEPELRAIRGNEIVLVPPDATAALNPVVRVGDQVVEGIAAHRSEIGRGQRRKHALEMFRRVGLPRPELRFRRYPHELSGGMQQRVLIASALLLSPSLVLADEPTTALDVTIQAQILRLLLRVREEFGSAVLFVTHDLATVAEICDRVLVMYAGRVVESAPVGELFAAPRHPYTRALIASVPPLVPDPPPALHTIPGAPPDAGAWPVGCRFADRCELRVRLRKPEACHAVDPALREIGPRHSAACHFAEHAEGVLPVVEAADVRIRSAESEPPGERFPSRLPETVS